MGNDALFYIEEEEEDGVRILIHHIHQDVVDKMKPIVEAGIGMHQKQWDVMADAGKGQPIPFEPILKDQASQALLDILRSSNGIMARQALNDLRNMQDGARLHDPADVGNMIVRLAQVAFTISLHAAFDVLSSVDAKAVEDAVLWALNASYMVDDVHKETGAFKEFVVFND